MGDRPILFSAPMVKGLLAGRKTQTRRVFTPPKPFAAADDISVELASGGISPRQRIGDRLWVKETWAVGQIYDGMSPSQINPTNEPNWCGIRYAATDERRGIRDRNPLFMPRWASRLTLIVTNVRIERLHDISDADAIAEGIELESADPPFYYVPGIHPHSLTAVGLEEPGGRHASRSFAKLWSYIHGLEAWSANPWVTVISFTVHRANIDTIPVSLDIAGAA